MPKEVTSIDKYQWDGFVYALACFVGPLFHALYLLENPAPENFLYCMGVVTGAGLVGNIYTNLKD